MKFDEIGDKIYLLMKDLKRTDVKILSLVGWQIEELTVTINRNLWQGSTVLSVRLILWIGGDLHSLNTTSFRQYSWWADLHRSKWKSSIKKVRKRHDTWKSELVKEIRRKRFQKWSGSKCRSDVALLFMSFSRRRLDYYTQENNVLRTDDGTSSSSVFHSFNSYFIDVQVEIEDKEISLQGLN